MSKILAFKEWTTIAEAAKYLTDHLKEPINEDGILNLALSGRLKLSVILPQGTFAKLVEPEPIEKTFRQIVDEILEEDYPDIANPLFLTTDNTVRRSSDKVSTISGIWDLAMIAGDRTEILNSLSLGDNSPHNWQKSTSPIIVTNQEDDQYSLVTRQFDSYCDEYRYPQVRTLAKGIFPIVRPQALDDFVQAVRAEQYQGPSNSRSDSKQEEIVFFDDLVGRQGRSINEILALGISGKFDVYSIIKSNGTGCMFGISPDDPYANMRGEFSCIYQLSKNDLLSLRADKEMKTSISFRHDSGLDPDGEPIINYNFYDFKTDIDGWDFFLGNGEICIDNLFTYRDETIDSILNEEKNDVEEKNSTIPGDKKQPEKDLGATERKKLHLIIAALVNLAGYCDEPDNTIASDITKKVKVSQNTIVKHLRAAFETNKLFKPKHLN